MAAVKMASNLSKCKRQLAKANEQINNQQKAHIQALEMLKQENEELREELKKEKNFRHDRQENNENDPEKPSNPCSFLWSLFLYLPTILPFVTFYKHRTGGYKDLGDRGELSNV